MTATEYTTKLCKQMGLSAPEYLTVLRLVSSSAEVRQGEFPETRSFEAFLREGLLRGDGGVQWLDAFGIARSQQQRKVVSRFDNREGVLAEWQTYRHGYVTADERGYVQLVKSGDTGVVPDFLVSPECVAGETWNAEGQTVTESLPTQQGSGIRIAYDNEDVTPMLALKVMQLAGYTLPEAVQRKMPAYRKRFERDVNKDFFAIALRLAQKVDYLPQHDLEPHSVERFVSRQHHMYDAVPNDLN